MFKHLCLVLALAGLAATPLMAQATGDKDRRTLTGCVAESGVPQAPVTFADSETGAEYRLTGKGLKKYAGQRVEIVGGPRTSRFVIRGGLFPSPNVAAQAGALDPVKIAIAGQPGGSESGTGRVELLPEFRVSRVRALEGSCQ